MHILNVYIPEYVFWIASYLAVMVPLGVAFFYSNESRISKRLAKEDGVLRTINRLEVYVTGMDGKQYRRILNGDDARNWWKRWVFRHDRIDISTFKWETVEYTPVKEIKWPQ